MADNGPSIKLPFTTEILDFLGDAKGAAALARKEIALADKELKAFASQTRTVSAREFTAVMNRKKQAEITLVKYKQIDTFDKRFKTAERSAKLARAFGQAQSARAILSGDVSATSIINLLSSDKLVNAVEKGLLKAGLPKLAGLLGKIAPIAGILEIGVDAYKKISAEVINDKTIQTKMLNQFSKRHIPLNELRMFSKEFNRFRLTGEAGEEAKQAVSQQQQFARAIFDEELAPYLNRAYAGNEGTAKALSKDRERMQAAIKAKEKKLGRSLTQQETDFVIRSIIPDTDAETLKGLTQIVDEARAAQELAEKPREELTAREMFFEKNPEFRSLQDENIKHLQPRIVAKQEAAKQQAKAQLNSNQYDPWHQSERDQQLDALRVLRSDEDPDVREYARTEMARLINGNPPKKSQNKSDAASEVVQMNMKRQGIFSSGNTSAYLDTNGSWIPENERNDYKGPSERKQAGIYSSGNDFGGWVPEGDQNDYKGPSEKRASGIYSGGNTAGYLSMNNNWIPEGINDFVTWQLKQDVKTSVQGASRNERVGAYSGD